jgi:hypothetical protein
MTQRYLKGNELEKQTIDRMQIDTKCCGSSNYTDWLKVRPRSISMNILFSGLGLTNAIQDLKI